MEVQTSREWSGRVPRPGAVVMLQVVGVLSTVLGLILFALGALLGFEELARIYAYLAGVCLVVAPFALLSGWARPPGLVAGLVAMAILLVLVPIGTLTSSLIGFFAIKNKDHIRDYYSQPRKAR